MGGAAARLKKLAMATKIEGEGYPLWGGEEIDAWVTGIYPKTKRVFVEGSNYGRLPISDGVRAKYLKAFIGCESMLDAARGGVANPPAPEVLSEFKGMIGRCLRGDTSDWYTVFQAFGFNDRWAVKRIYELIIEVQRGIKEGRSDHILNMLDSLYRYDIVKRIHNAKIRLNKGSTELQDVLKFSIYKRNKEDRHLDIVEMEEYTDYDEPFILSAITKKKLDRANKTHSLTLETLAQELLRRGYIPERSIFIDLFCRLEMKSIIFEVKSITIKNWLSQIRKAISQLYEYRFIYNILGAQLCLVLSHEPPEPWVIDYVQRDRGIHICWRTESGEVFSGPGWQSLFGEK